MSQPIVSIRDLSVHFRLAKRGLVRAVDGVSFDIAEGETLGLVGESGCGKTTLGRSLLWLVRPTGGEVRYKGTLLGSNMRAFRRHMQMIFQDPYASLDPRMSVGSTIAEPIHALGLVRNGDVGSRVERLMNLVGLNPRFIRRYPHEFSGGQRQRIGIARALAAEPDFIVADEPISALDVSIQAQILNLLEQLQDELRLTYLFISHDLRAVHYIANRVAVMYVGEIVELAQARELYERPYMPYTRALISAVPPPHQDTKPKRKRIVLTGDVPSPVNPPPGCRFHTRCPYAIAECAAMKPQLREITPGHWAACIRIGSDEPDIDRAVAAGIRVQP
jgi:oligopeptide transport system ATP-binding protein